MKKQQKEETKELFNLPNRLKFLIKLSKIDIQSGCIRDFERQVGCLNPNPDLRFLLNTFIEKEILILVNKKYGIREYSINVKKLHSYILSLDELQELFKLYEDNHTIVV
jgi:hypothetical protein